MVRFAWTGGGRAGTIPAEMAGPRNETRMGGSDGSLSPTLWTVVLRARDGSAEAMGQLAALYWKPAYFYIRRWGSSVEDAKDLTQGFFARLIEQEWLKPVSRDKGRFRAFLLTALRHFLVNEAERGRAAKRGGGRALRSLDFPGAESEYASLQPSSEEPDAAFKRQWALQVLQHALASLQRELPADRFNLLRAHLGPGEAPSYEETARALGISVADVKNLLHRTRKRYRTLIREEVARLVNAPSEVEQEVRDLFAAF